MALYHHSSKDYNEAATEAAKFARAKMEKTIADGMKSAEATFTHVMTNVPSDALVRNRAIDVDVANGSVIISAKGLDAAPVSEHALGQLCTRVGGSCDVSGLRAFTKDLLAQSVNKPALGALVRQNLATLLREAEDERYLVRTVQGQHRGVLSDSYKRIDARPNLEAFMLNAQRSGLVPIQGIVSETKTSMRALLPVVFEPAPNEVMCFGVHWQNSDFGSGANTVDVFMLRLWCTNFAISERALRQVHLGKRLDDVSFSRRTHQLEARAQASALGDIVGKALAPDRVDAYCNAIAQAASQNIDANKALDALVKNGSLQKGERKLIGEKFVSADVEMLPAGNTTWRLSNAISWFAHAGQEISPDRRVELERVAGEVLPSAKAA